MIGKPNNLQEMSERLFSKSAMGTVHDELSLNNNHMNRNSILAIVLQNKVREFNDQNI
jgi:hypothetical protein